MTLSISLARPAAPARLRSGLPVSRRLALVASLCVFATAPAWAQTEGAAAAPPVAAPTAAAAPAAPALAENAPDQHVVVAGDTLWGIAGRFLKSPWQWPTLWRMNQEQIKNPHRIYPGDVLVLDRNAPGGPRLSLANGVATVNGSRSGNLDSTLSPADQPRPIVRLSPTSRSSERSKDAIYSIPRGDIEPFISRPLLIEPGQLDSAPNVASAADRRVMTGSGDTVYVTSIPEGQPRQWQIFRVGSELRDPTKPRKAWWERKFWSTEKEVDEGHLGHEALYLADAKVLNFGQVAKVEIVGGREEVVANDRLIPAPKPLDLQYVPRAPERELSGVVVKLDGPLAEAGRGGAVVVSLGTREGMEVGHVLSLRRPPRDVPNPRYVPWPVLPPGFTPHRDGQPPTLLIPEERIGLAIVFRVFERVAYALIVSASGQIGVGDIVRNP